MGKQHSGTRQHVRWSLPLLLIWIAIQQTRFSAASTFDGDEWTMWSTWTPCSRSCDGGITQQFRRCKSPAGCHGVSIRRKMCNMQPCTERRDYRSDQCTAFNGLHYKGRPRNWEAIEDPENACAATCRAEGTDIIAKLSPKLRDGTRCRAGTLHVCVDGTCEPVGCDLKLGSPKKVDECGICGGDGTSCTTPVYRWAILATGTCSASCGGGQQSVKVVCRNSLTDEKVDPFLCNSAQKPQRTSQNCNIHPCEPEWQTGEWSVCSVSCGSGLRIRRVFCAQEKNASKIQVSEKLCKHIRKPVNQEPCNTDLCPHWHVGPWSMCSVSCGDGVKTRNVVCRDAHNLPSSTCDPRLLPADTKACDLSEPCPTTPSTSTAPIEESGSLEDVDGDSQLSTMTSRMNLTSSQIPDDLSTPINSPTVTDFDLDLDYLEAPEELPREHTLPLIQPYMDNAVLYDQNAIPSEPTFVAEPWGPCSQTCGEGIRRREVNCKIFLEFTRTVANLPDKECFGPKPLTSESCFARPCPLLTDDQDDGMESLSDSHHAALADSDSSSYRKTVGFGLPPGISMQDMTFSWKVDGYTPCSASCLGGVQERRIVCVRDYDQRAATPVLCMDKPRPDIPTTRTCNDHPCPPRWNVSDFGSCSKPCGGGVMTRDVSCIHEVTRGNTVTVPNTQCPHPVPRTERLCNAINCPPYWEPGDWDRCSEPCGGGVRTRKLICKQIIALGQVVERSPAEVHCTQPPPANTRPCNKKPCNSAGLKGSNDASGPNDFSISSGSDSKSHVVIQQHEMKRKLSLTVRGHATVFNGITLRLRCPSKSIDRARLVWMKDHDYVHLQPHKLEIIPKSGALKIKNTTFSDSGIYTCLFNERPLSNITLMVQPYTGPVKKPGDTKSTRLRQNFEDVNKRVGTGLGIPSLQPTGKGSAHESTLYADQQPGVSVGPIYGYDTEGHRRDIFTQNNKKYSGPISSSSSCFRPPFYHFLQGVAWVIWPLSNLLRSTETPAAFLDTDDAILDLSEMEDYELDTKQSSPNIVLVGDEKSGVIKDVGSGCAPVGGTTILGGSRSVAGSRSRNRQSYYYRHNRNRNAKHERRRRHHQHTNASPEIRPSPRYPPMPRRRRKSSSDWATGSGTSTCANQTLSAPAAKLHAWKTSDWTECSQVNCFTWNTSTRKRDVYCQATGNEVRLRSEEPCTNTSTKPAESEECYNKDCHGVWITEPWSQCKARCSSIGFKTRILKCVWFGSGLPAGTACHSLPRPVVKKPCAGVSCLQIDDACKDHNPHCPAIKIFNLCQNRKYQLHCCKTCFHYKYPFRDQIEVQPA